jgi:serine phosphatase RsbU (regulator of sigma subunit)
LAELQQGKAKEIYYIQDALKYGEAAFRLAESINSLPLMLTSSNVLQNAYKKIEKYSESLYYAEVYIAVKDSMFREEKTKAIAEMQTKYETEKKQQEIEKQQLVIEKQEIDNRRQRNQRNFFIAGTFLLALLALVVFRSYQQKKKSNEIITEKNALLEQANEEIAAQRDLVMEQKEHIERIHEELTSSIRYARRIQGAVLPSNEQMGELLGDHFVLFKPKDIVSGDFYWATRVRTHSQTYPTVHSNISEEKVLPLGEDLGGADLLIFCVADCTGHGVPGAFMSMLGVSFLNDIVHKEQVTSASDVLNHLRESVIAALKQKGEGGEQKDGMDMGLCVINTETKQMQFAGGYNPCWVVPNPKFPSPRILDTNEEEEGGVIQLKPDKMPIAIHKHMESYTNHNVQLYPGDQIYLMSDGFQDQFGGPQGKKFMVKNLRELVVASANLPMGQQREVLEKTLEEWKSGAEQVDDVTIIGVKV